MFKVGITGGIGSGKSTVARVFGVLGIPVFDADSESKRLLVEDADVKGAVIAAFGATIYPGGRLDRAALAAAVFNN
ncbi:MAG TPA: dephospho-CoA kinase, partial [Flavobacteriales bacterium]|nr:dephospho-CoA kinase [Flavobacteriales bacterium]